MHATVAKAAVALEVKNLGVLLGSTQILRDLSFQVPQHGSLAIIGPNGSGKTMLLKALIGAVPHSGTIHWAKNTILGYVPQKLDIERDLPLSGWDFLHAKVALSGGSTGDIEQTLRALGLSEETLRKPIGTLSGGQFQRLLVAFALQGRPTMLLLDEPAAGVDAPGQMQLTQVIETLRRTQGMTVLLVSHDLSVVYRNVDYVLCLGREHTCFGPPHTTLTPELLEQLYEVPVALHVHDS